MREKYIEQNKSEFGNLYKLIPFPGREKAEELEALRTQLLSKLSETTAWGMGGTKGDMSSLSRGCRLCTEGMWSCLFINGQCNCDCFYCPASQNEKCLPTTNSVSFESPEQYVAYLREFGFKGASISGGEPLLTPELTLAYIQAVKDAFGSDMYVWMYTNGTLATTEIIHKLKNAGLDEIRFDIGATDYDLSGLAVACGVIPHVTVEVPAVPEELARMQAVMAKLAGMGVSHLNLHQLRLTPYNFKHMIERDYTYIHNESVTVIESELTALRLMLYAKENSIDLPINYCSFPYKNRYQGYANRKRYSAYMIKPDEILTENGYIRQLSRDAQTVQYFSARQLNSVSYRNPFQTIKLTDDKSIVIERFPVSGKLCEESQRFELMPEGLLGYY